LGREAGDFFEIKLDPSVRRRELVLLRIGAEGGKHHTLVGALRDFHKAIHPEAVEIGNGRLVGPHVLAPAITALIAILFLSFVSLALVFA
jgi:hypothetical protein